MSYVTKTLQLAALAASFATAGAMQAQASPFGPADATISFLFAPVVTTTAPTGTANLSGNIFASSADGTLHGIGAGTGSGTITFSTTPGSTVVEAAPVLFSFADGSGGFFNFDLTSVKTTSFLLSPGVSSTIALYLLGITGDTNLGLTATPTSVTLTLNQTGTSQFSASASLANPPAPPPPVETPEPATLTLLGVGLLGLGAARRRSL